MSGSVWAGGADGALTSKIVREIALSDLTTALIAAVNVGYFRVYAPFRVLTLYASLLTVSSSGLVTLDINVNGATVLATKLSIDANEKDNTTAVTPYIWIGSPAPTFRDFAVGDEVKIDLDAAGTGAMGLILYMVGFDI